MGVNFYASVRRRGRHTLMERAILGDPPTFARAIIDRTVVVSGCPGYRRRARSLSAGVPELAEDATVRVHDGHLEATFGSLDQNAFHVIATHRCAVPRGVYPQTRVRMAIRRARPIRHRQGTARAGACAAACPCSPAMEGVAINTQWRSRSHPPR